MIVNGAEGAEGSHGSGIGEGIHGGVDGPHGLQTGVLLGHVVPSLDNWKVFSTIV